MSLYIVTEWESNPTTFSQKMGKLSSQVQHRFADKLYRGKVVQTLSWPIVDQIQDSIQLRIRNLCEISSSGEEETKQTVHILVAASLPGRMCIRKINLNLQSLLQFFESKELRAIVQSQCTRANEVSLMQCRDKSGVGGFNRLVLGDGGNCEAGLPVYSCYQIPFANGTVDRISLKIA